MGCNHDARRARAQSIAVTRGVGDTPDAIGCACVHRRLVSQAAAAAKHAGAHTRCGSSVTRGDGSYIVRTAWRAYLIRRAST